MSIAEITNLILGALVVIGGVMVGLKRLGIFGNGNGSKKGNGKGSRAELASKESKEEIDKLWDEKQGKDTCDIKYDGLKEDIGDLKKNQDYLTRLMTNVAVKVQAEVPQ